MPIHPKEDSPRFTLAPTIDELLGMLTLEDVPGSAQEIASVTGIDVFLKLVKYYAGDTLYVPTPETLIVNTRHRLIRSEYTGKNHKQLARKWGLNARTIYCIVRAADGK